MLCALSCAFCGATTSLCIYIVYRCAFDAYIISVGEWIGVNGDRIDGGVSRLFGVEHNFLEGHDVIETPEDGSDECACGIEV